MGELVNELLARAVKSGMPKKEMSLLEEQFRLQIEPFLERGIRLYLNGTQMKVDTVVQSQGFTVSVNANFGTKPSLWQRLFGKG